MKKLLANLAVLTVALMFPVFMITLAWGLVLMLDHVPLWFWVVQCFSVVAVALGVALLFDSRQPPPFQ